jgi:hypothetical protein
MITNIDANACRVLRASMETALAAVKAEHGVEVKVGKATYDQGGGFVTFKVEMAVVRGGNVETKEAVSFKQFASMEGFAQDDLGKEIRLNGKRFTIHGYNSRATKKPVLIKEVGTNKIFITDVPSTLRALGKPVPNHLLFAGVR